MERPLNTIKVALPQNTVVDLHTFCMYYKAKTNADRNREYRLRKGEEINAKRREARLSQRAIITPKIEYEEKTIKKVAKLPSAKTAKQSGHSVVQQMKYAY